MSKAQSRSNPGRRTIVLNGGNLFGGGPFSILLDCVRFAAERLSGGYDIIVLVNDSRPFLHFPGIHLMEVPDIRRSYFHRIYYEYFQYKKRFAGQDIHLWLSLNDISSRVQAKRKAVYCHNALPFRRPAWKELADHPRIFLLSLFYKQLYRANLSSNDYIIVQQNWFRTAFSRMFDIPLRKIIVANPVTRSSQAPAAEKAGSTGRTVFFYPTLPRPFKNIEIIGEAAALLEQEGLSDFEVIVTIDGTENRYARRMVRKYGRLKSLRFIGLISRDQVSRYYQEVSALIFPSKLETWGLPISEFKAFGKPILAADLPYARETVGNYAQALFFNADEASGLAAQMGRMIRGEAPSYTIPREMPVQPPFCADWAGLFQLLLTETKEQS